MPGMADPFQPELRPPRPYPGFLNAVGLCVVMLALILVFAGIAFALGKVLLFKPPQAVLLGVVNTLAIGIVLAWAFAPVKVGGVEWLLRRHYPARLSPR